MSFLSRLFRRRETAPPTPDAATLEALRRAGADLSRETETRFYLYLPTEGHARSAATVASREGYQAEVREPVAGYTEWLCLLTCRMAPTAEAIDAARLRLEELAESLGGEFDGWEAAVG